MKKVLLFAYPLYADFEIAHTLFYLRKVAKANIITATINGESVESLGGLITEAQTSLSDVDITEFDLVLISGGDGISEVIEDESISRILNKAIDTNVLIASICASAALLGKAGILREKEFTCLPNTYESFKTIFEGAKFTNKSIQKDKGYITAKGTAFAEFTVAVGEELSIWRDQDHANHALKFCKGEI
jgi:putative intracellular protease/amidase